MARVVWRTHAPKVKRVLAACNGSVVRLHREVPNIGNAPFGALCSTQFWSCGAELRICHGSDMVMVQFWSRGAQLRTCHAVNSSAERVRTRTPPLIHITPHSSVRTSRVLVVLGQATGALRLSELNPPLPVGTARPPTAAELRIILSLLPAACRGARHRKDVARARKRRGAAAAEAGRVGSVDGANGAQQ